MPSGRSLVDFIKGCMLIIITWADCAAFLVSPDITTEKLTDLCSNVLQRFAPRHV